MAKVYTIIDFFSIEDNGEPDQCWVANFSDKENAIAAFESKLKEIEALDADGKVSVASKTNENEKMTVRELFESMLSGGFCFNFYNGSQSDNWFVRGEEIQTDFNAERISWE